MEWGRELRSRQRTEKGGHYIVFFYLFFIVMRQVYPKIFYQKRLCLHLEVVTIVVEE